MLKFITEILASAAILTYFTGWLYLYFFLRQFGFSIFEVDIPFHYFLVYSFPVLMSPIINDNSVLNWMIGFFVLYFGVRVFLHAEYVRLLNSIKFQVHRLFLPHSFFIAIYVLLIIMIVAVGVVSQSAARALQAGTKILNNKSVYLVTESTFSVPLKKWFSERENLNPIHKYFEQNSEDGIKKARVLLVFTDKSRHFLILKEKDRPEFISFSIAKKNTVFLGQNILSIQGTE